MSESFVSNFIFKCVKSNLFVHEYLVWKNVLVFVIRIFFLSIFYFNIILKWNNVYQVGWNLVEASPLFNVFGMRIDCKF